MKKKCSELKSLHHGAIIIINYIVYVFCCASFVRIQEYYMYICSIL